MKTTRFNFYSTIITILLAIIFASVLAIVFGSCTKSTRPVINDNDPIGPYHVRDPLTEASIFNKNVDTIVCDHFYVARAIPVMEWDHDFPYWSISPKDCICVHCKKTETCY